MNDDLERDLDLMALAEGGDKLSPRRRAELKAAIDASPALTEQFEATRLVVQFIDQMPSSDPSPAFSAQLQRRLDTIDEARSQSWWQSWLAWPRPVWAGGALAAVAAGAVVFLSLPAQPPPAVPQALAQAELLDVAENLDLLEDFDVIEQLDVLEDLEVIEDLDSGEPG